MKIIDTYQLDIGSYQEIGYNYLTKQLDLNEDREIIENNKEGFGYNILQKPLQALNMVYPCELLDNLSKDTNLQAKMVFLALSIIQKFLNLC